MIISLWVAACAAALALATTSDDAAAQQGCGGGGSPSPSASASSGPAASQLPIPSIPPSLVPAPDQKRDAAPEPLPAPAKVNKADKAAEAAELQQSCRSTITLTYKSGKTPKFAGKVGSDEAMCKRARNVTIKKVKRGADPRVAKATTNARGNYSAPARKANGRFYSKVSKATVENDEGQTITCGPARSRTIRP